MGANSLNFSCDWRFGMNLDARGKATVGYLLFWSGCGGLSLARDIEIWNPFDSAGQTVVTGPKIQCIGVIESFGYDGGESDPIRIVAYVSKSTAADVRAKLSRPLSTTKVKLVWYIIGFDDDKKAWYEAALVKNKAKAEALVDTVDGVLQLFVASEPTRLSDTLDIRVYKLEFQAAPAPERRTTLEFATGVAQRLVKTWAG
jgi:hypothetical protein